MTNAERLNAFAQEIERRASPLGHDFTTGCWGAEAARIASDHGLHPCEYFGFSLDAYEQAIKKNAKLPAQRRNAEMASHTLGLAERLVA